MFCCAVFPSKEIFERKFKVHFLYDFVAKPNLGENFIFFFETKTPHWAKLNPPKSVRFYKIVTITTWKLHIHVSINPRNCLFIFQTFTSICTEALKKIKKLYLNNISSTRIWHAMCCNCFCFWIWAIFSTKFFPQKSKHF